MAKDALYNRELSWVDFNARVLEEAFKKTNPIMERCNFLQLRHQTLTIFFMVCVAGVFDQIHHGKAVTTSGMTPTEVMDGLVEKIHEFAKKQYSCYINCSIIPSLRSAGIVFKEVTSLTATRKRLLRNTFKK